MSYRTSAKIPSDSPDDLGQENLDRRQFLTRKSSVRDLLSKTVSDLEEDLPNNVEPQSSYLASLPQPPPRVVSPFQGSSRKTPSLPKEYAASATTQPGALGVEPSDTAANAEIYKDLADKLSDSNSKESNALDEYLEGALEELYPTNKGHSVASNSLLPTGTKEDKLVNELNGHLTSILKYYNGVYKPKLAAEFKKKGLTEYWAGEFEKTGSREFDKIAFKNFKKEREKTLTVDEWKELENIILGKKSATEIEFEKVNESNIGLATKAYIINIGSAALGVAGVSAVTPFLAPVLAGSVVILFFCKTLAEKYKSKLSLRNLVNDLNNICLRIYQTIDNINKSISKYPEMKEVFNDEATLEDLNNSLRDVYVYIMSLYDEPELQIMSNSFVEKEERKQPLTETEMFIWYLIDDEIKIRRGGSQMNRIKRAIGFRIFNSPEFTLRLTSLMTKLNSNLILYYNNFLAKGIMNNKVIQEFNLLQDITSRENKIKQEGNAPINLMTNAINITPDMVSDFRSRRGEFMDTINRNISTMAKKIFEGYNKIGIQPVKTIKKRWGWGGHTHRITKKQRRKGKKTYKRKPKKFKRTLRK